MDQMNISITDQLADYVREKVNSGRYNNASEVVRDALRRMEEEDARSLRLAEPSVEDVISDLDEMQLDAIRRSVLKGIDDISGGNFQTYQDHDGLMRLADEIGQEGRKRLRPSGPHK